MYHGTRGSAFLRAHNARVARRRGFNRYNVGAIRRTIPYASPHVPAKEWTNAACLIPFTPSGALTTGTLSTQGLPLHGITQNTGPNQRVNRKIRLKSLVMRGSVVMTGPNIFGSDALEIYVILDTQANGAIAGNTAVFVNTTATQSMLNLDNSQRFRVLKHCRIEMGLSAFQGIIGQYGGQSKPYTIKVPVAGIVVDYAGTSGVTTEVMCNDIVIYAGSFSGISQFQCATRVRYYDY